MARENETALAGGNETDIWKINSDGIGNARNGNEGASVASGSVVPPAVCFFVRPEAGRQ